MKKARLVFALLIAVYVLAAHPTVEAEDSCAHLKGAKVTGATILLADPVAAGAFAGPPAAFTGRDLTALYKSVPAFCRVVVVAKPTVDSEIRI